MVAAVSGRVVYQLSEQLISAILKLPEGQRVIGVRDDFYSLSVLVMVEGPDLPEHEPGAHVQPLPLPDHLLRRALS